MTALERRSFAVAVALGLIYLALIPLKPYPLSWLLKPIPMLTFALLAWRAWRGIIGILLAVAFIGAAGGDFFLDYGDRDGLFIQALCSFLVNQRAIMACRVEDKPGMLWLGAMLFVIADSLIGVNKFAMPFEYAVQVIVAVYFTGQVLIAAGVVRLKWGGP